MRSSIESLTIKASTWTLIGYGSGQLLRFAGHILVALFLTPADFGLTQLVYVFIQGIQMFSDVGLGVNVIQHKRGDEPLFLQTAWTIQILRGILLWIGSFIIAWPIAYIYNAPQVTWLLPLAGLGLFIEGFSSTQLLLLNRKLEMKTLAWLEVVCQLFGISAMVICAWHWHAVWTLLIAGLVYSTLKMVLSLTLFPEPKMRLRWDKEAAHAIQHFGKWIFLSSIVTFFATRLDRIVLGLYLSKTEFGLYGIASNFVIIVIEVVQVISNKVLLPLYSHLHHNVKHEMQVKILRIRSILLGLSIPMLIILAIFGKQIVHLLYIPAYYQAGWMLQVIAAGAVFRAITSSLLPILLAVGDSFRMMMNQCSQAALMMISMYAGGELFGSTGLIFGAALTEVLYYPIVAISVRKYQLWTPSLDFGVSAAAYAIIFFGIYSMGWM